MGTSDKIYKGKPSIYGTEWHQKCSEDLKKGRQLPQVAKKFSQRLTENATKSAPVSAPISNLPKLPEVDITHFPSEIELEFYRVRREIVQVRNDNRALNTKIVHLLRVLVE